MQSGSMSYFAVKSLNSSLIQNVSDRVAIIVHRGLLVCLTLLHVALRLQLPRWSHSLGVIG